MPDFLKALDELVTLYEKQDDFRAKSFKKAKEALEGQGSIIFGKCPDWTFEMVRNFCRCHDMIKMLMSKYK